MSWLLGAQARLRLLLRRRAADERMDEEFRFHVEMETERRVREGADPAEARRQALIAFGGVERHRETMRQERGLRLLEDVARDLRHGVRMLARQPGFTLASALTIALGVGATTVVFGLMNAVLLRPLPVPAADRLYAVTESRDGAVWQGLEGPGVPYSRYVAYRDATEEVFTELAAHRTASFSLDTGRETLALRGALVSGNYFAALRLRPAAGRFFDADDEPAVVLGHRLWLDRFGGDPDVVGAVVRLDSRALTVLGIAPEGFDGATPGRASELWVPVAAARAGDRLVSMSSWLAPFGRLRSGLDAGRAAALVDLVATRIPPDEPQTRVHGAGLEPMTGMVRASTRSGARTSLLLFLGAGVAVLLIACANVGAMLLARGLARRREVAIRMAVGAGRGRLVRQLLSESVLLAAVGGAGGVLLAVLGSRVLGATPLSSAGPVVLDPGMDLRVLGFALAVTLVTAVLSGLAPALRTVRPSALSALKDGGLGGGPADARGRSLLVAAQLATAVVLLSVAGLFIHAFQRTMAVDLGYDPTGLVVATTDLEPHGYDEARGVDFYDRLVERLRAVPGVESVALARAPLLGGAPEANDMEAAGAGGERIRVWGVPQNRVDPAFFATIGLPLVAGRGFAATDAAGAPGVVIVNEALARRFWPDDDPLGRTVSTYGGTVEVVGVVRDGRYHLRGGGPAGFAFLPFAQRYAGRMTVHVRSRIEPGAMVDRIRQEVRALDPNVAVQEAGPLTAAVDVIAAPQRTGTVLISIFGLVAVVLAGVGVYGVLAFQVARRTRELGVRMALGAPARAVVREVLGRVARISAAGVALGSALGAAASVALSRVMFGVHAVDPATFAGIALVLAVVAILAGIAPVRRALRVDPVDVLRSD